MKSPLRKMVYEGFHTAILSYLKEKVSNLACSTPLHEASPVGNGVRGLQGCHPLIYLKEKVSKSSIQDTLA